MLNDFSQMLFFFHSYRYIINKASKYMNSENDINKTVYFGICQLWI